MKRPDDKPAAVMTHAERVVFAVAVVVALICLALLAALPGAPPEPGFDRRHPPASMDDDAAWTCTTDANACP